MLCSQMNFLTSKFIYRLLTSHFSRPLPAAADLFVGPSGAYVDQAAHFSDRVAHNYLGGCTITPSYQATTINRRGRQGYRLTMIRSGKKQSGRRQFPPGRAFYLALIFCGNLFFAGCGFSLPRPFTYSTFVTISPGTMEKEKTMEHPDVQKARQIADEFLLAQGFVRLTNPKRAWIEVSPYSSGSIAIYEWQDGSKVWWGGQAASPSSFTVGFYLERGGIANAKTIKQVRDALALEFERAFGKSRVGVSNPT